MIRVWRFVFFSLVLGMSIPLAGQHSSQYSLYMHERYAFNPAFGGMERSLAAGLLYRSQWGGLNGNPELRMLNVHMPFYLWQGAIGFQLVNESIGAEKQTGFLMSYNYIYESPIGLISTGLRAGIYQKSLDGTKLRAPDGTQWDRLRGFPRPRRRCIFCRRLFRIRPVHDRLLSGRHQARG